MKMVQVSSSTLSAVGYDPAMQTHRVAFIGGGLYEYSGVPASVHSGLMSPSSLGSYFDAQIKKGSYRCRKID
jgi:hypothetical protein